MSNNIVRLDTVSLITNCDAMTAIANIANSMSSCQVTIPEHLRGNTGDCMAIAMQAVQWNMNPYSVAQKTHIVNGVLGYEAQLVNAVISSSSAIEGRFKYKFSDGWEKIQSATIKKGVNKWNKECDVKGWSYSDEKGLYVQVGAVIRGEESITWGSKVYLSTVLIRNSPLWISKPDQQLSYLALKYWARLYTPDVILGVYDAQEIEYINNDNVSEKIINDDFSDNVDIANKILNSTPKDTKNASNEINNNVENDDFFDEDDNDKYNEIFNIEEFKEVLFLINSIVDKKSHEDAVSAFDLYKLNENSSEEQIDKLIQAFGEK